MITVVVVDDHPAVVAGLIGLLESEPGVACVAAVTSAAAALDAVRRTDPAVVVADYELRDGDGLSLCAELKSLPAPPGVLIYTAFARPRLVPAAAVAGADAMLDKGGLPEELFEAIRSVARGARLLPAPSPDVMESCLRSMTQEEVPLFGMAVNGVAIGEIAEVVRADIAETRRRLRILLGRLQQEPARLGS